MEKYFGDFSSWEDVKQEFGRYAQEDCKPPEVEPEVIYAEYEQDGYEGSAWVVYKEGDKYYLVEGSHCSCYGLEDQWCPEENTKESLLDMLDKAANSKYVYGIGRRADAIKERLT